MGITTGSSPVRGIQGEQMQLPFNERAEPSFNKEPINNRGEVKITITYQTDAYYAEKIEKEFQISRRGLRCPSCHILWSQTHGGQEVVRHREECKWPEMVIESQQKSIRHHQGQIAYYEGLLKETQRAIERKTQ